MRSPLTGILISRLAWYSLSQGSLLPFKQCLTWPLWKSLFQRVPLITMIWCSLSQGALLPFKLHLILIIFIIYFYSICLIAI